MPNIRRTAIVLFSVLISSGALGLNASATAQKTQPKKKSAEKPLPQTGAVVPELKSVDRTMEKFIRDNEIPGAAVAIVKDGRLVYARGFGYADIGKKQTVQPASRFRIASISKPITAVAVLRLVQQKKLSLDDKVLDILKYKPHLKNGAKVDPRWKSITVRQCLQHTGGWDRGVSFDAMFKAVPFAKDLGVTPPAKPEHVIRCMLGVPLDFDPGKQYAYSNFGYCLLGRIIEKKTGKPYDRFVREDVLKPIGVKRIQLGHSFLKEQADGEVRYYTRGNRTGPSVFPPVGKRVPWQYGGWHLEAMDSHGGWIASAVDLARFAAAIDRPEKSHILTKSSIATMIAPPPAPVSRNKNGGLTATYYGLGWSIRPVSNGKVNTWHTGSLDGTSTILVRRHDGVDFAVLFNTRDMPNGNHPARHIDPLMNRTLNGIKTWPKHDLFKTLP